MIEFQDGSATIQTVDRDTDRDQGKIRVGGMRKRGSSAATTTPHNHPPPPLGGIRLVTDTGGNNIYRPECLNQHSGASQTTIRNFDTELFMALERGREGSPNRHQLTRSGAEQLKDSGEGKSS